MIGRIALGHLRHRPWRSALLFAGFGLGVGVMIVLLAIGEAMMAQARDERLVGGGDVTVLPEGVDLEMLKTGGVGGMWFSIPNARFLHRQVLVAPRTADAVALAAPQVAEKLLYLRARGREVAVRGVGEVPSLSRAAGAVPPLAAGTWGDDDADRAWRAPTPAELLHQMDRLHHVPASVPAAERASWAEWHYVTVASPDASRRAYVTLMLVGDVPAGRWEGRVLVTLHRAGAPPARYAARVPAAAVRFDTTRADLDVGASRLRVRGDGTYEVTAEAAAERGGPPVRVALVVTPAPRQHFPGADLGGAGFTSGYAVPVLRGEATGTVCVGGDCWRAEAAPAYHDHNWGTWRMVTWEWGSARVGDGALLFGRVRPQGRGAAEAPLFLYLTDPLGFRALFRPRAIAWTDDRTLVVGGARIAVPSRGTMTDVRGGDTVAVELTVEEVAATDTRQGLVERGEADAARTLVTPWFLQLQGRVRVRGRVGGVALDVSGRGVFETYR